MTFNKETRKYHCDWCIFESASYQEVKAHAKMFAHMTKCLSCSKDFVSEFHWGDHAKATGHLEVKFVQYD